MMRPLALVSMLIGILDSLVLGRTQQGLQIFGLEAGVLRQSGEHARADFLSVVECEHDIWPAGSG